MLLFARTEARVMRGIVKGAISIYSPDGKLSQLGKEMRVAGPRRGASRTRAKQKLISMAKFPEGTREILFSLSSNVIQVVIRVSGRRFQWLSRPFKDLLRAHDCLREIWQSLFN